MQKFGSGDFDVVAVNVVFLFLAGGIIPSVFWRTGSESRKYDGDGALDGWNPLYCFGRGGRGGSGAVETGCGGIGMLCTDACRRKKEGLTDAEAGVVVLYVWNDAAAGSLPPGVPPVSSDLSIGNGRAPSGGKEGIPGGSRWRSARERMYGIRRLQKDWNRKRAVHFSFYPCGTEEEAKKAVMTGWAECAYLFPERLKERLDEGHYTRSVRVLVSPSTVAEKIISEKDIF